MSHSRQAAIRARHYEQRDTLLGWVRSLTSNAKTRAKNQDVPYTLDRGWVRERLQRGVCELTGLPFDFTSATGRGNKRPFIPSVDRIIPKDGYTPSNCRVVCLIINEAMNAWGIEPVNIMADALRSKR